MPRLIALFVMACALEAQRTHISALEARRDESLLRADPNDRAARRALLQYYFLDAAIDPVEAIEARRRHILWLIHNTPADPLAGSPAATIDAAGNRLADPEGFKLASESWREQAVNPDAMPQTLVNAAYFFKLPDKAFSIALLERALKLRPGSKEIGARLGDEYALAILGITMENQNGYPQAADVREAGSPAARAARKALVSSENPYALAKAGYMLSFQGAILYYTGRLSFDPAPLAEAALQRAVGIAPADRDVANYLSQYYALRHDIQQQLERRGTPQAPAATVTAARSREIFPAAKAPAREIAIEDFNTIAAGMSREDVLKLGEPAGRITMTEDGHVIEIFDYISHGVRLGSVRLTDGIVSSIKHP